MNPIQSFRICLGYVFITLPKRLKAFLILASGSRKEETLLHTK